MPDWPESVREYEEYRDHALCSHNYASPSGFAAKADAIIPLNEEQAEAYKALSESIRTERSLRDELAVAVDGRDYYREHYELVLGQRIKADAAIRDLKTMVEKWADIAYRSEKTRNAALARAEKAEADTP